MEIYKKLAKVKISIGKISKDSTNPFFKSKYFDVNALLEHIEPELQKNGLLLLQPIIDGFVVTQIINPETGEKIESSMQLNNGTDPQKKGSEITYYRRYTLQSLLGLQAGDDDGNMVSGSNHNPIKTVNHSKEEIPWLNVDMPQYKGALAKKTPIATLRKYFRISKANAAIYEAALKLEA